jgi:hypothetical protein
MKKIFILLLSLETFFGKTHEPFAVLDETLTNFDVFEVESDRILFTLKKKQKIKFICSPKDLNSRPPE